LVSSLEIGRRINKGAAAVAVIWWPPGGRQIGTRCPVKEQSSALRLISPFPRAVIASAVSPLPQDSSI